MSLWGSGQDLCDVSLDYVYGFAESYTASIPETTIFRSPYSADDNSIPFAPIERHTNTMTEYDH